MVAGRWNFKKSDQAGTGTVAGIAGGRKQTHLPSGSRNQRQQKRKKSTLDTHASLGRKRFIQQQNVITDQYNTTRIPYT